jgi:hypothetical protein
MNIFDLPPDDPYLRRCQRMALQGLDPSLPIEPEAEPSNVFDIRAARTMRAVAQLRRGREVRQRPL